MTYLVKYILFQVRRARLKGLSAESFAAQFGAGTHMEYLQMQKSDRNFLVIVGSTFKWEFPFKMNCV